MKRSIVLAAFCAIAFAACQPPVEKEPIKIGLIAPLTGDLSSLGSDILNATTIAVDTVNEAGGINGQMVELIAEDGQCDGPMAASAAQKLINVDSVVAVLGGQCSGAAAAAPIAEAAGIPLISPISSSPDLTTAGEYVYRTYPSDDLKGKAFAQLFVENEASKVALVSEDSDFCKGILASIEKYLPEDTEIVFSETVDTGTTDFSTVLADLEGVEFDVFIVNTLSDVTGAALLAQLRESGSEQIAYGTDTTDSVKMFELAEGALDNFFVISMPSPDNTTAYAVAFRERFGEPQFGSFGTTHPYDAANVLLNAMTSAGTDGAAIKQALDAMGSYVGEAGTFSFDENGDAVGYQYALKSFQDGVIADVQPITVD